MPTFIWDGTTSVYRNLEGGTYTHPVVGPVHDWSEDNLPWAYTSRADWEQRLPAGVPVVDLSATGATFWDRLNNTQNSQTGRFICRLPEGVFSLTSFRMIGSSGSPTYAFGFWWPKLAGFTGAGPDKTYIQMAANSMSQAQLDALALMDPNDFSPNHLGLCRFDGTDPASPIFLGGVTFRAADQQMLTAKHPNLNVVVPQPAPHNGVVLYNLSYATISHVRFQGAARAINSQPPFEHANVGSQRGHIYYYNCESDGRRSSDFDPARPRRCSVLMGNNEFEHHLVDCWLHHSNVSRYAVNDENSNTQGNYTVTRTKLEQITNTQNTDPNLNSGNSLGGYTNATPFGWESINGTITITDCIVHQDNPLSAGQVPMIFQLTSVGARNPQGGRMYVHAGAYHWVHSQLEGFVGFRIQTSTYWWQDGLNNTLFVYHPSGTRLVPYQVTGGWPPSAATLAAQGVTPQTHYLVRAT